MALMAALTLKRLVTPYSNSVVLSTAS